MVIREPNNKHCQITG